MEYGCLYVSCFSSFCLRLKMIGIIQNSEEDLKKIKDLVLNLTNTEENVLMMFPLGITIHWVIHKNNVEIDFLVIIYCIKKTE